jgi:hypothetical protein
MGGACIHRSVPVRCENEYTSFVGSRSLVRDVRKKSARSLSKRRK